jgi:hypothetical protein
MWIVDRHTFFQILGRVVQQDDVTLGAVCGLIHHLNLETSELVRRLLEHLRVSVILSSRGKERQRQTYLAQVFHGHLQILLVVLEDLRLIVARQVVGESISPLESLTTLL